MTTLMQIPETFFVGVALILGLIIGSFLNVIIYRVPAGIGIGGRSHCPKCDTMIAAKDNIPVLAWLLLRGKCRSCSAPISKRYPLVELANGLAWAGLTAWQGPSAILPLLLFLASVSIALTMIDFDTMRLPDIITLPSLAATSIYLVVTAVLSGDTTRLAHATVGAAIYAAFFLAIYVGTRGRGLGFGDVKLAPTLGALVGWFSVGGVAVGIMAAFVVGGIPAGILLYSGVVKKGTAIPFGPMLILGAWTAVFFGPALWDSYAALFHHR